MRQARLINESLERSECHSSTTAGKTGTGRVAVATALWFALPACTLAVGDLGTLLAADPPG
ncbi:MAG: hypothetical protein EA381_20395, partial [Planctomycetaceae bacterium]